MEGGQGHPRASFPSAYQRIVPLNSLPKTRIKSSSNNATRYNESKVLEITLQQCQALGKSFIDTVVKVMRMQLWLIQHAIVAVIIMLIRALMTITRTK